MRKPSGFTFIRSLVRDRRGVSGLVVALSLSAVTMLSLGGIDYVRAYMIKSRAQSAIDAAVLSAGHSLGSGDCMTQGNAYFRANLGENYLGSSVSSPLAFTVNGTAVTATNAATACALTRASGDLVTATATVTVPLLDAGFISLGEVSFTVSNEAQRTTNNNLELVLALDTTGSMGDSAGNGKTKLATMQEAAADMVTTLFGSGNSGASIYIGLVPFTETVRAGKDSSGTSHAGWLTEGTPRHFASVDTWGGCFSERFTGSGSASVFTLDATPPATMSFEDWRVASYDWLYTYQQSCSWCTKTTLSNAWDSTQPPPRTGKLSTETYGHNYVSSTGSFRDTWASGYYGCTRSPVTFLSSSASTLNTNINGLSASGATMIASGMGWAWRMLSPAWRNSDPAVGWGNATLPRDPGTTLTKAIVLLTDGNNAPSYIKGTATTTDLGSNQYLQTTPYYPLGPYQGVPQASSKGATNWNSNILFNLSTAADNYTLHVTPGGDPDDTTAADSLLSLACAGAKADGITVFTVALNTNGSITAKTQALLQNCASDSSYSYNVTDANDLTAVFAAITGTLSELRLIL